MIIKTGEGKYETTVTGDGRISIKRKGVDWRNETGDGYIYSLLSRIDELQEQLKATPGNLELPACDLLPGDVVLRRGAGSDKTLHSLTQRGIGGVLAQWTCGGSTAYSDETVLQVVRNLTSQQKPVVLRGDAVVYEHITNGTAEFGTLPNGKKVTAEFAAGFNYRGEVDKIALDAANVKWEVKP